MLEQPPPLPSDKDVNDPLKLIRTIDFEQRITSLKDTVTFKVGEKHRTVWLMQQTDTQQKIFFSAQANKMKLIMQCK